MAISIITTTHDAYDKLLKRAIDSVLNQSFQDWELIIVKDGGKNIEKTLPKDERIRYIHAKKFGAHPRPKNIGTLAAKYDLIAYLDADNAFRKDHLMALYKEMKPGVDVVYGDHMNIKLDGTQTPLISTIFHFHCFQKNLLLTQTMFYVGNQRF